MTGIVGFVAAISETTKNLFRGKATVMFPGSPPGTVFVPLPENIRASVKVDKPENCIVCYRCEKVCPSHAIKITELAEPGKFEHRLRITQCLVCGQCVEVCPKDAMHLSDEWLLADMHNEIYNVAIVEKKGKEKAEGDEP